MDNRTTTDHIIDIKETCARIEQSIISLEALHQISRAEVEKLSEDVVEIQADLNTAKGSISTIKWLAGASVAVPSLIIGIIKLASRP